MPRFHRFASPLALCAALSALSACLGPSPAHDATAPAVDVLSAPLAPRAVRVVDGDTLDLAGWPDTLRLAGIDSPEEGHRAGCKAERELADLATRYARDLLDSSATVRPDVGSPPVRDRWGRYVGTVELQVDGGRLDYGAAMIAAGYAKAWDYDGGEPKPTWCGA